VRGAVRDLIDNEGFRDGLLVGAALALACFALASLVAVVRRGRAAWALPVAGLAVCAGSYIALRAADVPINRSGDLLLGLVLLALGGGLSHRLPFVVRLILLLPGTLFIVSSTPAGGEVRSFLFAFVLLGAAAAVEWPHWSAAACAGPAMLAVTVAGVYACTPETGHAIVVLGVGLPIGLTGWPVRTTVVGSGGAAAFVGLVAWVAGTDGVARSGAIVGGSACVGVLVLVPVLRWVSARSREMRVRRSVSVPLTVLAVHSVVVLVCSRIAGLRTSAVAASAIVLVAAVGGVALLLGLVAGSVPRTVRQR
jgi:hypothetical protein